MKEGNGERDVGVFVCLCVHLVSLSTTVLVYAHSVSGKIHRNQAALLASGKRVGI